MGKASIIYVIGLGLLVAYALLNINFRATETVSNSMDYYGRSMAHNVAVAGANVGTHYVLSATAPSSTFTGNFYGGTYSVTIDSVNPAGDKKVMSVSEVRAFTKDGHGLVRDTVIASLRYTPFAKYGYFSGSETNGYMSPTSNSTSGGNMWKVTGDSMFGYAHTNGRWNLGGRPYFHDKITGFNPPNSMVYGGVYDPIFNAGSEWGITVNRPSANITNLEGLAAASAPNALFDGEDVSLEFLSSGNVKIKIPALTGTTRNETVALSSLTSNGVIAVKNADVRVKGTYKGKATIVALKGTAGGGTKGNIWIDDNLVAASNPNGNQSSPDMLGLVSERMTYVTTKDPSTGLLIPRTAASVTSIQAAIYCHDGIFGVQDYDTVPVSGRLNLFGALTMAASTSTGKISGGSLVNGFLKSIRHDPRFLTSAPPNFPVSDKYELVSWWEN